jgi:hypothetical protein
VDFPTTLDEAAWVAFLRECIASPHLIRMRDYPDPQTGPGRLDDMLGVLQGELEGERAAAMGGAALALVEARDPGGVEAVRSIDLRNAPGAVHRLRAILGERTDELRARGRLLDFLAPLYGLDPFDTAARATLRRELARPYPSELVVDFAARHDPDAIESSIASLIPACDGHALMMLWSRHRSVVDAIAAAGESHVASLLEAIAAHPPDRRAELEARLAENPRMLEMLRRRARGPLAAAVAPPDRPKDWRGVLRILDAGAPAIDAWAAAIERLLARGGTSDDVAFVAGAGSEAVVDTLRAALPAARGRRDWSTPRQAAARALLFQVPQIAWGAKCTRDGERPDLARSVAWIERQYVGELPRDVAPPRTSDLHCPICGSGALERWPQLACDACRFSGDSPAWSG